MHCSLPWMHGPIGIPTGQSHKPQDTSQSKVINSYPTASPTSNRLTHWGRVTHICVSKLTIIGSDNGLLPGRRQAIIWTNAGILLIGPLGTNFSEISIRIQTFSFKKMHLKMSSAKWRPFRLGLNVLRLCSSLPYAVLELGALCTTLVAEVISKCS